MKLHKLIGKAVIYVYASNDASVEAIRDGYKGNDSGDIPFEDFKETFLTGELKEITDLNQVPQEDHWILPYEADELVELPMLTIDQYFSHNDRLDL